VSILLLPIALGQSIHAGKGHVCADGRARASYSSNNSGVSELAIVCRKHHRPGLPESGGVESDCGIDEVDVGQEAEVGNSSVDDEDGAGQQVDLRRTDEFSTAVL